MTGQRVTGAGSTQPSFVLAPDERCGWPRAILFDLDGTLVDSVGDIRTALNLLRAEEELDPLALDAVRGMVGNGIAKLVQRAFAADGMHLEGDALAEMARRMMEIYAHHLTIETELKAGAREIVRAYHRAGAKIAVVTNKPEAFSRAIIDHFELSAAIHAIVGGDSGPARKPAADMLLHACALVDAPVRRAIMVGDSSADVGAAHAAGMASIAVLGGYTTVPVADLGAHVVIDTLNDLPAAIERLKSET